MYAIGAMIGQSGGVAHDEAMLGVKSQMRLQMERLGEEEPGMDRLGRPKYISQNVFLKMYFSKCISQNVLLKISNEASNGRTW